MVDMANTIHYIQEIVEGRVDYVGDGVDYTRVAKSKLPSVYGQFDLDEEIVWMRRLTVEVR